VPATPENTAGPAPVPLTVWTTHSEPGNPLPSGIIGRILGAYSQPGDLVVTTSSIPDTVAGIVTAAGRAHRAVNTSGTADIPPWILLTRYPQGAGLLLDWQTSITDRTALAALYTDLAGLLRPGGILLTFIPDGPPTGADPLADTVAAALAAGLIYTQHLLTIHLPIPHSLLTPPLDSNWEPADEQTPSTSLPPLRIHSDLAVFTRPASRSSR